MGSVSPPGDARNAGKHREAQPRLGRFRAGLLLRWAGAPAGPAPARASLGRDQFELGTERQRLSFYRNAIILQPKLRSPAPASGSE